MQDLPPPFSTSAQHVAGSTVGGCGGFFLTDMFDDNDLFACTANQKQVTTNANSIAAMPLPVTVICKALEIDESVPSGLRWKTRPPNHFKSNSDCKAWNTKFARKPAGSKMGSKIYFRVAIGNVDYRSHRIIFFLHHGVDPLEKHVDHINPAIPFPNVASNLRLATQAENMRNRGEQSNNTSGVPGVVWNGKGKRWMARIKVDQKDIYLSIFTDFTDAVTARKAAEVKYFGEFAYDTSRKAAPSTKQA